MRSLGFSTVTLSAVLLACASVTCAAVAQESKLDGLRAATKANPGDPTAALALGRALDRAGHPKEALSELHRGMAVAGAHPAVIDDLYWAVARVYAGQHDLPHAMAACRGLDRNHQPTVASHACMAVAHLAWQRASEALTETAAALAKDPNSFDAKVAEGRAYDLELKSVDAEASLREAVSLRPDSAEAHMALGRVLLKAGKKDNGVAELRRALQCDPSDPYALYELGAALPPGPESLDLLARSTRERPTFEDAWLSLGTQELSAGNQSLAQEAADSAVRNDPGDARALVLAGKIALANGRADDALRTGKAALKLVANNSAAELLIADANAKKGEIDLALEAYQAAWGFDHSDPAPLVRASEACHAATRDTSARAFGAKAAEEFPNWAPAWAALGDALAGQRETAAARDAYRKALAAPEGSLDRGAVNRKLVALNSSP